MNQISLPTTYLAVKELKLYEDSNLALLKPDTTITNVPTYKETIQKNGIVFVILRLAIGLNNSCSLPTIKTTKAENLPYDSAKNIPEIMNLNKFISDNKLAQKFEMELEAEKQKDHMILRQNLSLP